MRIILTLKILFPLSGVGQCPTPGPVIHYSISIQILFIELKEIWDECNLQTSPISSFAFT